MERLLAFLPTEVPALEGLLYTSGDSAMAAKVKAASSLELRYSDDGGVTQMAVELATRNRGRFVAPVSVGVLFFLEIEVVDASAATTSQEPALHRVGVALTRPGAFSVFAHTAMASSRARTLSSLITSNRRKVYNSNNNDGARESEVESCTNPSAAAAAIAAAALAAAASPSSDSPTTHSDQALKRNIGGVNSADTSGNHKDSSGQVDPMRPVKVMTYNVWNLNPPPYVYKDAAARWQRYEQRIDQLVKVTTHAHAKVDEARNASCMHCTA